MYESHFGFSSPPFQLNPDPAFYFNSKGHSRALAYLQYGVTQGEGFIVITGEIGAGKTTLVRTLIEGLDRQKVLAAQIVSTQLESGELLQAIITAFGIPAQGSSKAHLIATLEAFLTALAAQGRHALLIVDEAQNLNQHAVEELRMLSNFQLGNHALLQSFLVGQPELRRLLESPSMEQLRQRVTASCHLGPLGPDETRSYVEHRMRRVGWNDRPRFEPVAFDQIYRWSGGVPRRINRLCNRLLLATYLEGSELVTSALVEQTADELRSEIGEGSYQPLPMPVRDAAPAPAPVPPVAAPVPVTMPAAPPSEAVAPPAVPSPAPAPLPLTAAPPAQVQTSTETDVEPVASVDDLRLGASPEVAAAIALAAAEAALAEQEAEAAQEMPLDAKPAGEAEMPDESAAVTPPATETQSPSIAGDAGAVPAVEDVARRIEAIEPAVSVEAQPVTRVQKPARRTAATTLVCVADTALGALKLAAIAKALSTRPDAPRMVLVNPGVATTVWPWEQMERLLPTLDVGLHLGATDERFESMISVLAARMSAVLDEFMPSAVVTLGRSDAVFGCGLLARKRGLPLICLEAGERGPGEEAEDALLESLADLLVAVDQPLALPRLYKRGIAGERICASSGPLDADAFLALWPEVTTPYGVFMRHAMPIYLGPTWSEHAGKGTPYALACVRVDPRHAAEQVRQFTQVRALPKTVWILDSAGAQVLRTLLASQPALGDDLELVEGDGPRSAGQRERMDRKRVLCRVMPSLIDQLSLLRGASCALVSREQVLARAAALLEVPCIDVAARGAASCGQYPQATDTGPTPAQRLDDCVRTAVSAAGEAHLRGGIELAGGAADEVASHLSAWLAHRVTGQSPAQATALAA